MPTSAFSSALVGLLESFQKTPSYRDLENRPCYLEDDPRSKAWAERQTFGEQTDALVRRIKQVDWDEIMPTTRELAELHLEGVPVPVLKALLPDDEYLQQQLRSAVRRVKAEEYRAHREARKAQRQEDRRVDYVVASPEPGSEILIGKPTRFEIDVLHRRRSDQVFLIWDGPRGEYLLGETPVHLGEDVAPSEPGVIPMQQISRKKDRSGRRVETYTCQATLTRLPADHRAVFAMHPLSDGSLSAREGPKGLAFKFPCATA